MMTENNIVFTDPATAEKYTCQSTIDKEVRLITHNHQGMLSNIPLTIADELYRQQSNLLAPKPATGQAKVTNAKAEISK